MDKNIELLIFCCFFGFDKTIKQLITQKIYGTSTRYALQARVLRLVCGVFFHLQFPRASQKHIFKKVTIPGTHNSNSIFILIAIMHGEKN
jgi:hypothetical protein